MKYCAVCTLMNPGELVPTTLEVTWVAALRLARASPEFERLMSYASTQ